MLNENNIYIGDSVGLVKKIETESIHLILSDIPYGIGVDDWDVLHSNTNGAYLGSSPAQKKAGVIFQKRGKPLNGWSEADRLIPRQYYEWVQSWAEDWFRVLKPGASAFVFSGRRMAHRCTCAFEDVGFTYKDMLAWEKERAAHRAQRLSVVYTRRHDNLAALDWEGWKLGNLRPVFEPILWFVKPYKIGGTIADNVLKHGVGAYNESILRKYTQTSDNVLRIAPSSEDHGLHPTQKPLRLMELLIELTTREKQTVLDPFCGSGTTLLAASNLKRKYIGIERDIQFAKIAMNRLSETKCLF